eukprot:UN06508
MKQLQNNFNKLFVMTNINKIQTIVIIMEMMMTIVMKTVHNKMISIQSLLVKLMRYQKYQYITISKSRNNNNNKETTNQHKTSIDR